MNRICIIVVGLLIFNFNFLYAQVPSSDELQVLILKRQYESLQRIHDPKKPDMVFKNADFFWLKSFSSEFLDTLIFDFDSLINFKISNQKLRPHLLSLSQKKISESKLIHLRPIKYKLFLSFTDTSKIISGDFNNTFVSANSSKQYLIPFKDSAFVSNPNWKLRTDFEVSLPKEFDYIEFLDKESGHTKNFENVNFKLVKLNHNVAMLKCDNKNDSVQFKLLNNLGLSFITQNEQWIPCKYYDFFDENPEVDADEIAKFIKNNPLNTQKEYYWILSASGKIAQVVLYLPKDFETKKFTLEYVKK